MLEEQNRAIALHRAGRLDQAAAIYRRILEAEPDNGEALHLLGVVAGQRGDYDECARLIERAICHEPDVAKHHANLGTALRELRRFDEAAQAFERAIALDPDYSEAHYKLGNLFQVQKRSEEAIACYRRSIALDPCHVAAHNNLGLALESRDRLDEAVASYRRVLELDPAHAEAYSQLGSLFWRQGENEKAIAAYRFAIELDPSWELPAHFLAALTGETTQTAPVSYVRGLFDSYAGHYENHMVEELQYRVPTIIRGVVGRLMEPGRRFGKAIDLGCGTGMSGVQFRDAAKCLHGVDLSPRMIEESEEKNVYDRLEVANIRDFLSAPGTRYDLFIAADVFVYMGALDDIFAAVCKRAEPNAFFAFSTETCEGDHYVLTATGRYAHSMPYVEGLARENGFRVGAREHVQLRLGSGQPVMGDIYVLLRSSA